MHIQEVRDNFDRVLLFEKLRVTMPLKNSLTSPTLLESELNMILRCVSRKAGVIYPLATALNLGSCSRIQMAHSWKRGANYSLATILTHS